MKYQPGLDGIRGLAILVVVVFHAGAPIAGWAGVTVFFVLSGYLITGILLAEWRKAHTLDLPRFYARRALRLLPALVAVVGFVTLVEAARGALHPLQPIAALFYFGNWLMAGGTDIGALGQTWSLAVEEQFYLVWPALLIIGLRFLGVRRTGVACCAYAALMAGIVLFAPVPKDRIAYGSGIQGLSLAAGCGAALLGLRIDVRGAAPAAAALILLLVALFPSFSAYEGPGLVLVTAASVALVTAGGLAFLPLVWLGRISYGLYLWHFSLMHVLGPRSPVYWVVAAVSPAIAWASYRWLESPWLRLKDRLRTPRERTQRLSGQARPSRAAETRRVGTTGPT